MNFILLHPTIINHTSYLPYKLETVTDSKNDIYALIGVYLDYIFSRLILTHWCVVTAANRLLYLYALLWLERKQPLYYMRIIIQVDIN